MIDAVSNYEDFGPRPIEENRNDFINLFGDVKLYQGSEGALWARLGRQELDLTADWQFSPRTDLLFGYSHFFAGDYYFNTPGVPHRGDADFFYTQFTLNF